MGLAAADLRVVVHEHRAHPQLVQEGGESVGARVVAGVQDQSDVGATCARGAALGGHVEGLLDGLGGRRGRVGRLALVAGWSIVSVARDQGDGANTALGFGAPRHVRRVEVHVAGRHDLAKGRCPEPVAIGHVGGTPEVDARDTVRGQIGLHVCVARQHGDAAASERLYREDTRLDALEKLVARLRGVSGPRGAVEHVHRVIDGVWPEADGTVARDHVRAGILHDRANGAFGDPVERVYVWGARRVLQHGLVRELLEFTGQELARVVRVDGSHDPHGL